jgi:hypothetical protein
MPLFEYACPDCGHVFEKPVLAHSAVRTPQLARLGPACSTGRFRLGTNVGFGQPALLDHRRPVGLREQAIMKQRTCIIVLGLAVALIAGVAWGQGLGTGRSLLLDCAADRTTAVRFFYNPGPDYFHFPLVFRAVPAADPRLGSAPTSSMGRTAYISQEEMGRLLRGLAATPLSWNERKTVEPLGSFKELIKLPPKMQVLVQCSGETASTLVEPKEICRTLTPLDAALGTPRALWEFQLLRGNDGCAVPGFNIDAYPGRH